MDATNPFEVYRSSRRNAFVRLQELRERMDAWLEDHEHGTVSMSALALLEGLNSERDLAIHTLRDAEAKLLDHLIAKVRTDDPQSAPSTQG